ncbi:MAG: hypothetical protein WBK19_08965, partial [Azonexus sp.]
TVKQMSANDSELPLAKVGQRQTTHTKSPVQLTLNGAFAFVEEINSHHQNYGFVRCCEGGLACFLMCG